MALDATGIHSVPPEILIQILLFDVGAVFNPDPYQNETLSFRPHYARVAKLQRVCKLWKAILEESSLFWTKVSSDFASLDTRALLRKSGTAPLDIVFQYKSWWDLWLRQLSPHFSRVRNFVLATTTGSPTILLEDWFGGSLTTLQILAGHTQRKYTPQASVVFAAELPQLRRLIHGGAPVTLNWPAISTLTHLEVTMCRIRMFGINDWPLSVLRNNPMLEVVKLRWLQGGPTVDVPNPPIPIHLNHLTTLHLVDNDNSLTFGVLSALSSPAYSDLRVDLFDSKSFKLLGAPSSFDWSEKLNDLASSVLIRPHTRISIEVSVWSWPEPRLNMDLDGRRVLQVRFREQSISRRLPELVACICLKTNAIVELSFISYEQAHGWKRVLKNDEAGVWELLASMPNLTILDLQLQGPETIVEILTRSPPVFPKLKCLRLRLTQWTQDDFMVPVLRYRNAIPTVASLEELMISSTAPAWHAPPVELEALLVDAALVWQPTGDPDDRLVFRHPPAPAYRRIHSHHVGG